MNIVKEATSSVWQHLEFPVDHFDNERDKQVKNNAPALGVGWGGGSCTQWSILAVWF